MWSILTTTIILGICVRVRAEFRVQQPRYSPPSAPDCGIVNETDASSGSWPWIVAVGSEKSFFCTGSIISTRHILTSAHCVAGWKKLRVRLRDFHHQPSGHLVDDGTSTIVRVERKLIHPRWTEGIYKYDIAVLTLEMDLQFTDLQPICLPTHDYVSNGNYTRTVGSVAGWGDLTENGQLSSRLLNTEITVLETSLCECEYKYIRKGFSAMYSVCASNLRGSRGRCWTDYGSPLMVQQNGAYHVIGLYPYIHGNSCAALGMLSMFTSTTSHLEWIISNLN